MNFPSQKPPTSAEVARQAGVSRTTVSFVLNGVLNRGISEATRERVASLMPRLSTPLRTNDTVVRETPAWRATSALVGGFWLGKFINLV